MTLSLKEIVELSPSEQFDYPDQFTDTCGLDLMVPNAKIQAFPSWGHTRHNPIRRVTLNISTFQGISSNAIHFYATMNVQGVYAKIETREKMDYYEQRRKYPLLNDLYPLKLKRPVTQADKDADKQARCKADVRFDFHRVGDLTERFNTVDEILTLAKIVFQVRFLGKWELCVKYTWKAGVEILDSKKLK